MASNQKSALAGRIAAGKAEPISAEERAIVAEMRKFFDQKYGGKKLATEAHRKLPKSA